MLKAEKAKRQKARQALLSFTKYTFPQYEVAPHHRLIAGALERVERGEIDRLLVTMPPRHGKSELVTKRFPAWWLGRNPKAQIITASYNSDLATDFGRQVRNIVNDPLYGNVFGTRLATDSKAANRWNTNANGAYVAAGVGTAVTGRGADLLIIDDPLKDRAEAESELKRQTVWDWYTSTAYTRLMPGGAVIVVQTRWHEDDLAGRLLEFEEKGTGDKWHKLDLPAISEDGKALWPERYPIEDLERIKGTIGPRDWSALYQQSPTPDDGDFFKREWFHMYQPDELPKRLRTYGTSDYAVSEGKGDYTSHMPWGIAPDGGLWLQEGWMGQTSADVWIDRKLDLIKLHRPAAWFGEKGVIEKAVAPMLTRRMRERNVFCRMEWLASIADKPTRARGFQARASMGMVHLPDTEYGHKVLAQLLSFPNGKHDDLVDTCSAIGMALDQAHPAIRGAANPMAPKKNDYKPRITQEAEGWR